MKLLSLRGPRIIILFLLCVSFLAPIVYLSTVPELFRRPPRNKEFFDDVTGIIHSKSALNVNSVEQEVGNELKEPAGIVFKDASDSESIEHASADNYTSFGVANGSVLDGSAELNEEIQSDRSEKLELHNVLTTSSAKLTQGQSNQTSSGASKGISRSRPATDEKVREMEDMVIMAKAYLLFAPASSNAHLVRELKLRIKEIEKVLGQASKDSDLSRSAVQRMRAMEASLVKADKAYPDCSAMASKLRAMTYNTEEQLKAQKNQATYLVQLAARTFPKGLHCLSMRLTMEYFALQPEQRSLPNIHKVQEPDLYHYAIFSDNVLACAVVVKSTISTAMEQEKIVFHIVTDSLSFPAMKMWFLMNPPGEATIQIDRLDDFKWLPPGFNSMYKQPGLQDPRYTSPLNHLRFYLPEMFPYLGKVLLLDHDVVVQRDLRQLWGIDMGGKVNGAVETCRPGDSSHLLGTLVDFSDPTIMKDFDAKSCLWAFGMNMFDLEEWRRQVLTRIYHKWLELGKRRQLWKTGSLPLGQLTFYNHTMALDRRWHVLGLGFDSSIGKGEVERAGVIHYSGNMKPWLEISIPKYRGYWNKFIDYDQPYLQQCNIHQ